MPKKIYDIKPPKVVQKAKMGPVAPRKRRTVRKEAPVPVAEKIYPSQLRQEKEKRFPLRELLIGGGVIVLLLGIYFYNTLAYATIEISPKTEVLSFQEKISADKSYDNVNLLKKIIPARVVLQEKEASQQFPATGSASNEGKATGTIKVYNKISPAAPLTLKAGTHFLSDSGKYFVSLDRIIIPASKGSVAGSIDVRVQAEESGTQYNIGASKFSVPGLSGTSLYYSIWAESKNAMAGGYTGNVKKVTAADISEARDVLTQKLLDEAKAVVMGKISQDEVLLDGAMTTNVTSATSDAREGAVAESFNETVKVVVSALAFKKDDLQKFAKLDAASKLAEGMDILEESVQASYTTDVVDAKAGIEKINLKVSATSYHFIDANAMAQAAAGKSAGQIEDFITSEHGENISAVKVSFWPFWVHTVPKDKNKVKIELNFE